MQLNASRIKVLQAQDDVVNNMKEAASKELLNVSQNEHVYRNILKDLIVQVSKFQISSALKHYWVFDLGKLLKVIKFAAHWLVLLVVYLLHFRVQCESYWLFMLDNKEL